MNASMSMTRVCTAIVIAAIGSSGTATAGIDGGGIAQSGPKVTKGPVSGFGSVFVNGVRYNTDKALFLIDGALGSESDLTGAIEAVDNEAMRFSVNGLSVDFRAAELFGLKGGRPQAGEYVEIVGGSYDARGAFIASRIYSGESGLASISGVRADIEGVITGFHSLSELDLGGTRVRRTWGTEFVNDWIFGLTRDRKVQVRGTLDATGTLVADKVVFEKTANEKVAGTVNAIAGDYLVVGSRLVHVRPATTYKDDSRPSERRFSIGNVRTGDQVEIRGYGSADVLHAKFLKRVDDEDDDDSEGD